VNILSGVTEKYPAGTVFRNRQSPGFDYGKLFASLLVDDDPLSRTGEAIDLFYFDEKMCTYKWTVFANDIVGSKAPVVVDPIVGPYFLQLSARLTWGFSPVDESTEIKGKSSSTVAAGESFVWSVPTRSLEGVRFIPASNQIDCAGSFSKDLQPGDIITHVDFKPVYLNGAQSAETMLGNASTATVRRPTRARDVLQLGSLRLHRSSSSDLVPVAVVY